MHSVLDALPECIAVCTAVRDDAGRIVALRAGNENPAARASGYAPHRDPALLAALGAVVDGGAPFAAPGVRAGRHGDGLVVSWDERDLLQEGRERLAAALEAAGAGTFRWDIRTNGLEWDLNLDRLFGLAPGESARSLDSFVAMVHPDDRAGVIEACRRCAAHGDDFAREFRVLWPDG